jgi:hypothetical protein
MHPPDDQRDLRAVAGGYSPGPIAAADRRSMSWFTMSASSWNFTWETLKSLK